MTEDFTKKYGSLNSKYCRYGERERMQVILSGSCQIYYCDIKISDKRHPKNFSVPTVRSLITLY